MIRNLLLALALVSCCLPAQDEPAGEERLQPKTFRSESLGRDVRVLVQLPQDYNSDQRYPVIYFLHGAGRGSERTWADRGAWTRLDQLVKEGKVPPCIVVCPYGEMSFWLNAKGASDRRFEDLVSKDLVAWTDATFSTKAERDARALLGDSMGGFGALLNAFKHPDVFGTVAAHSASIFPEDRSTLPEWVTSGRGRRGGTLGRLFGDPVDEDHWLANNLFHLAKQKSGDDLKGLRIYYDVGKTDRYGLSEPTLAFHELLKERQIAHEYHLRDGGHGRDYFLSSLPHSLAFIGAAFKDACAPKAANGDGKKSQG